MDRIPRPRFEPWERIIQKDADAIDLPNTKAKFLVCLGASIDRAGKGANFHAREYEEKEWIAIRLWVSSVMLQECVSVDSKIRGGIPVLAGTRMTIAQLLAEVADGRSLSDISDSFDLDFEHLQKLFEGMAIQFDRPFLK